ncbi:MAG: hypothetical protein EU531_09335 [Promethearchaeota archaeon]|nr:MAG: hypothetical protein EU531_09335 [Candidatus Lokiarchaeota archaeon]
MSYDISALKVLIKKIFPPKSSVYTIDTTGDNKPDSILIKALNVIMPIEVPDKIELGGFSTKDFDLNTFDLSEYGKIFLDGERITVSKDDFDIDKLKTRFIINHKGERFTVDDIIDGKLGGRLIALGDSIDIVIKLDEHNLEKFTEGMHKFRWESELIPVLEFKFELNEDNMNQEYLI